MVKGIGPVYAGKLVKAFGAAVFDIIEQSPERLREIAGIGEIRARKITSGWADQQIIRSIMVFLHAHGVSTSRAVRIFKTYGQDAIDIVKENPYRLARDIRGIGFYLPTRLPRKLVSARSHRYAPKPVSPMPSLKHPAKATAVFPTRNWCHWP